MRIVLIIVFLLLGTACTTSADVVQNPGPADVVEAVLTALQTEDADSLLALAPASPSMVLQADLATAWEQWRIYQRPVDSMSRMARGSIQSVTVSAPMVADATATSRITVMHERGSVVWTVHVRETSPGQWHLTQLSARPVVQVQP